jgi:hypothetical protein
MMICKSTGAEYSATSHGQMDDTGMQGEATFTKVTCFV